VYSGLRRNEAYANANSPVPGCQHTGRAYGRGKEQFAAIGFDGE